MVTYINLRGTPCPINFVRCSLEIEKLNFDQILQVDLDKGEPEEMVIPSLREAGYQVKVIRIESDWIRFTVVNNVS